MVCQTKNNSGYQHLKKIRTALRLGVQNDLNSFEDSIFFTLQRPKEASLGKKSNSWTWIHECVFKGWVKGFELLMTRPQLLLWIQSQHCRSSVFLAVPLFSFQQRQIMLECLIKHKTFISPEEIVKIWDMQPPYIREHFTDTLNNHSDYHRMLHRAIHLSRLSNRQIQPPMSPWVDPGRPV